MLMNIIDLKKLIKKHENEDKFLVSTACAFINHRQQDDVFLYNSHARRPAASLAKLFILGALAEAVATEKYTLKQKITITEYAAGSGLLKYITTPITLTLQQLVYLTVVYSDNSAANAILSLLTIHKVNEFINRMGACNTKVVTAMMSTSADALQKYNYTTADDVLFFYKHVFSEFPSAINKHTSLLCRKFFAPSRNSLRDVIVFLLSTTNIRCIIAILRHNPFALTKYIYATLSPLWNKRLTVHISTRQIVAQKKATGQRIFHDSCIIKKRNNLFCIVSMIECPAANFYQRKSAGYKAAFELTRLIGKTCLTF